MLRCAVVGAGRAGEARVKCVSAEPRTTLTGVVSRRTGNSVAYPVLSSLDEVLCGGADAVVVATENARHADVARRALAAGKHALVEYPLCLSLAIANELFDAAASARRVLHVEHIELISCAPSTVFVKAMIAENAAAGVALRTLSLSFSGAPLAPTWGHPAFSGLARLTRLLTLYGDLRVAAARWSRVPTIIQLAPDAARGHPAAVDACLVVEFATPSAPGATIVWTEDRRAGAARASKLTLEFTDGSVVDVDAATAAAATSAAPPPAAGKGFFAQDLAQFLEEVDALSAGDASAQAAARQRELGYMALADGIERLCPAPAETFFADAPY